ncbi:arginine-tRNA-protein transferase [Spirosoma sp. KUDC1026]|uniref:arginine-tRNA-protein transferase n=1 Tax=Spirosoma sp. KUDC1026 TaxID=2745947 RepID=UPI00159BD05C|nr:arginine-tRNA-protein transferase [Spirosoma sp. KUDC1026]QKZ11260.1 arginine-tRNA-protein transferase [Spirosoma sp. KUDC1026]
MSGYELDFFLSLGYFRMQQEVFTCRYLILENNLHPVYWLRLDLAVVTFGPKQSRLLRINDQFLVTVVPFTLTDELEDLYAIYRSSIDFDAPESVQSCLLGNSTGNVFDTSVVEVRDNGQLIAAGIFDNGACSIAGIMNFYHPDYRKQSLGKFLMLQKINYARQQRKTYYYPGYIVGNYPKFDYKLFACQSATEVLDENSGTWLPFSWDWINQQSDEKLRAV